MVPAGRIPFGTAIDYADEMKAIVCDGVPAGRMSGRSLVIDQGSRQTVQYSG
ncbi:MAG: hypothetical protein KatS3mg112_0837 [Thermogutta sp.]|nr:MAG: hypothetical protein KatS3mg112_0837 [Thermogutta sp.]